MAGPGGGPQGGRPTPPTRDLARLVDIEPFRVMVELLGHQGGARHEPECRVEILEHEFPGDRLAVFRRTPARELGERSLAGFRAEFLSHDAGLWVWLGALAHATPAPTSRFHHRNRGTPSPHPCNPRAALPLSHP